jgi:putative transposase
MQNRGVKDILIACVDGLKGFPDAINTAFPNTQIQLCIVHMVRNSMKYVSWKDYKAVTADLKRIYKSVTEEEALLTLDGFAEHWDDKYPQISKSWRTHWDNLNTLFNYSEDIRRAIYTTNAFESLNSVIRKAVKKWTMPIRRSNSLWKKFVHGINVIEIFLFICEYWMDF